MSHIGCSYGAIPSGSSGSALMMTADGRTIQKPVAPPRVYGGLGRTPYRPGRAGITTPDRINSGNGGRGGGGGGYTGGLGGGGMMTSNTTNSSTGPRTQPRQPNGRPLIPMNQVGTQGGGMGMDGPVRRPRKVVPKFPKIRGIVPLIKQIGIPTLFDTHKGGIAVWSRDTLRKRGYKFLNRVEIIDESIPSMQPVKHFSNIYIWVKIPMTDTMVNNVLRMSSDFYYDTGKETLIVRSGDLDSAVAQAALVTLYSKGKFSYYTIVNNDMLQTYYLDANKKKTRKIMYTVLDGHRVK